MSDFNSVDCLLERVSGLDDATVQQEILNDLQWTEPVALMLASVEDEALVVRVVTLALALDLRLGARLAGAVRSDFQITTLDCIEQVQPAIPPWLLAMLLGHSRSDAAIPRLVTALEDSDREVCRSAAEALIYIGSEATLPVLRNALKHSDWKVREIVTNGLRHLTSVIDEVYKDEVHEDESHNRSRSAVEAVGEINSEDDLPELLYALEDGDSEVRMKAIKTLGNIGPEAVIPGLLLGLKDKDEEVRICAIEALGKIGSEAVIPGLLSALDDKEFRTYRWSIAEALWQMGSDAALPTLLSALDDEEFKHDRWSIVEALGKMGSEAALPGLLNAIEQGQLPMRVSATESLGTLGTDAALPGLLIAIVDRDFNVRGAAVNALGQFKADRAAHLLPNLLELLPTASGKDAFNAIHVIQSNCKFYNYAIQRG